MLGYSYWSAIVTPPGYPSTDWRPDGKSKDELEDIVKQIREQRSGSHSSKPVTNIRYCATCNIFKPPRTHHCRHCKRCILKQDHHCPWIANCVGYQNQKPFILFLFYTTVAGTLTIIMMTISAFYILNVQLQNAEDPRNPTPNPDQVDIYFSVPGTVVMVLFILNFSLVVPVVLGVSGLFYFQSGFIFSNLTSVERYERKSELKSAKRNGISSTYKWRYDRGTNSNFKEVFGESKGQWLCPSGLPKGDGINWKVSTVDNIV
ncbi:hypothetical protein SAMD00019534_011260 [Acytostelium subglobosum LB1]|uniref:hypothetical protein n=1 Tax=Acytostelium subglobosum LB1 TaxID=1410327 RepID=UPI000644B022|nr:hypothetical protein SAMD00019534_011260 [Acytostelium subglobosum LB1]GAM17951.1 hypothetical protein SAMD00019534_011260 [Acytostelium subglobosum LB1]|eukprot:XP_012758547.1 hypothetical protein SAMD00019534_011260 [Acytostelium subglobosum LB1]